jgi:hypothetical protein
MTALQHGLNKPWPEMLLCYRSNSHAFREAMSCSSFAKTWDREPLFRGLDSGDNGSGIATIERVP